MVAGLEDMHFKRHIVRPQGLSKMQRPLDFYKAVVLRMRDKAGNGIRIRQIRGALFTQILFRGVSGSEHETIEFLYRIGAVPHHPPVDQRRTDAKVDDGIDQHGSPDAKIVSRAREMFRQNRFIPVACIHARKMPAGRKAADSKLLRIKIPFGSVFFYIYDR